MTLAHAAAAKNSSIAMALLPKLGYNGCMGVRSQKTGFTLIEISIVLVIIGLLAASILVGNELIAAARIRSQIGQIQEYTTAVTTFRGKYGNIPGDLEGEKAASFGFIDRSGDNSHGDGNGTLESCDAAVTSDWHIGCETALFWTDLSKAGLIDATLNSATDDYLIFSDAKPYLPVAKLGSDIYLSVFSDALSKNSSISNFKCEHTFCFSMVKNPMAQAGGGGTANGQYLVQAGITPGQAYSIDQKMDDGLPLTGIVLAGSTDFAAGYSTHLYYIPLVSNTRCIGLSGTANSYNLGSGNINQVKCVMNIVYR
jgi:prepilin-type N-terminal cleavage/methylation domain-containing protein